MTTNDAQEVRAFFAFDSKLSNEAVLLQFNLWVRRFFPKFIKHKDAPFHKEMDLNNLKLYRGKLKYFVNVGFRGCAKTTRGKLFWAYCIANDRESLRKYIRFLSADKDNANQITTDIYNLLISIRGFYPEIFEKTEAKREERMNSFTTAKGVKVEAGTVGTDQRGNIQEDARPDLIIFDDFETRRTLRSAVVTHSIWDNMEEAKDGLSKNGSACYNCNYLSERGNVHKLVQKKDKEDSIVMIIPIKDKEGRPTWDYFTIEEINNIEANSDDFAGERMCEPSAGADILFDREVLNNMNHYASIRDLNGLKIFHEYNPSHRYGIGADLAGGLGLDSTTSVAIDFHTIPCKVVATYASNTIKPDIFGDELAQQGERYGNCIIGVENNKYDMCIGRLKQIYDNIYYTQPKDKIVIGGSSKTYGWNTNASTKPKMLFDLKKAVEDGHLELTDINLINELKSYTRDDLMEKDIDPRLATRHFDLLIACSIAWQMNNHAKINDKIQGVQKARMDLSRIKAQKQGLY